MFDQCHACSPAAVSAIGNIDAYQWRPATYQTSFRPGGGNGPPFRCDCRRVRAGGLTAAALYARAGHRVLVLERNEALGGAAIIYRHGSLAIEASLHEIDGLDQDDPKVPLLRSLGLDRGLDFVSIDELAEMRGPAYRCPPGVAAWHRCGAVRYVGTFSASGGNPCGAILIEL